MEARKRTGPLGYALGLLLGAAYLVAESMDSTQEYRTLLRLGAVGCVLVAGYLLLVALKHVGLKLELQGTAAPGGKLVATLHLPGLRAVRQLDATLTCKDVVDTGFFSDENRYQEEVMWTVQASFPVLARQGGSECRIEFALPADARPTSGKRWFGQANSTGVLWELSVDASGANGRIKRAFVVPVGKMNS